MTQRDGSLPGGPAAIRGALAAPADQPGAAPPVSVEAVTWAFRLFIGREPRDMAEIKIHLPHVSMQNLRHAFAESHEFGTFYDSVVRREKPRYGAPPFLLRPAPAPIAWRLEAPLMDRPVCQLCTAGQFDEPAFAEIAQALALAPRLHRKVWEQVYIVSALATEGAIAEGRTAVALGGERARVAALLASRGMGVTVLGQAGRLTPRETKDGLHLFYPEIVHLDDFERLVRYAEADLRAADDLSALVGAGYDTLFTCGALHRLGRIEAALHMIEAAMALLRPGGIAVHTFDFNVGADEETLDTEEGCLPRRRDIEALILRLGAAGHEVLPLNLHPGHDEADGQVDVPPFGLPHLKVEVQRHVASSIGLTIRKAR